MATQTIPAEYCVRPGTNYGDVTSIARIEKTAFPRKEDRVPVGRIAKWVMDDQSVLLSVAHYPEMNDLPVGYAAVRVARKSLCIYRIAVERDHQRLGWGAALVGKIAGEFGALNLWAAVGERDLGAQLFFKSIGWRFVGYAETKAGVKMKFKQGR